MISQPASAEELKLQTVDLRALMLSFRYRIAGEIDLSSILTKFDTFLGPACDMLHFPLAITRLH